MPSVTELITQGKNAIVLHVSVFLLLLALATLIAIFMPIEWQAFEIYILVPPLFALYLGVFYLLRRRRRNRSQKETSK